MRHSEMIRRRAIALAEYNEKLGEINREVAKLNFSKRCGDYTIHFVVSNSYLHYHTIGTPNNAKNWSYEVKVTDIAPGTRNKSTVRVRDWMDLPSKIQRYIKLFHTIGDNWILGGFDLDWNKHLQTERVKALEEFDKSTNEKRAQIEREGL